MSHIEDLDLRMHQWSEFMTLDTIVPQGWLHVSHSQNMPVQHREGNDSYRTSTALQHAFIVVGSEARLSVLNIILT
jgi:hypothetical protein